LGNVARMEYYGYGTDQRYNPQWKVKGEIINGAKDY
jgi:hypothetical protein